MRGSCFLPLIFVVACATTTGPEPTAPDPCDSWNTEGFFKRASAAEVATCLGAGASTTDRNDGRDSPICMAARFTSDPGVIAALIQHGASANDWCAFNNWELSECYANASVLHVAARDNPNPAVLQALIDAGAQVNAVAGPVWTPLSVAWLWHNTDEVVALLERNGATGSIEIGPSLCD